MKKTLPMILAAMLVASIALSGCASGGQNTSQGGELSVTSPTTEGNATDAEENRVEIEDDFTVTTDNGSVTSENVDGETVYTLTAAGDYDLKGKLTGRVVVNAPDEKVTLNLCGTAITSSAEAPISVTDADKVEISAKSGTFNELIDNRALRTSEDEGSVGVIYAKCDLTLKGKGSLVVSGSYYNGIHTTKDLEIKNLTIKVTAPNNALKGNDSVTISSGNVVVISTGGDGIKTEDSDISSKGNQRGTVTISGGAVDIYAACDGIDASYNIVISDEANVTVLTDKYSEYTGDVVESSKSLLYLCLSSSYYSSSYRYAVYFYNEDGTGVWEDATYKEALTSGRTTYYYYEVEKPSSYQNMAIYRFDASQEENSFDEYSAISGGMTVNSNYDMYVVTTVKSEKIQGSWSIYSSSSNTGDMNGMNGMNGMQGGMGGMGGMQGGFGGGGNMGGNMGGFDQNSGNANASSYSTKGMKADNRIEITGGTITITSYDDSIHANADGTLENGETAEGSVYISGGEITLFSLDDAVHGDNSVIIDGGEINVTSAYEGIEGNQIEFNGGTTYVKATDDGVNASGKTATPLIKVTGGYLDVTVGTGDVDGIDSNGSYVQTGGFVISRNATNDSGGQASGLDTDGTCTITGGTFICVGAIAETPSSSSQSWVLLGSANSGMGGGFGGMMGGFGNMGGSSSTYKFTAGDYTVSGTDITFTLSTSYTSMWISSDQFTSGSSYTVTNGTTSYSVTAK